MDPTTTPVPTTDRATVALLIARVRLAAVVLGAVLALVTVDPSPVFGPWGMLAGAVAMLLYNIPALLVRRLSAAWVERVLVGALAGDMLVCTLWVMLTSNDAYSTSYVTFSLIAIEAAALHGLRGTALFLGGYALLYGACYAVHVGHFGFPLSPGSLLFRVGLVALVAIFTGGITEQSERRRARLAVAADRDGDLNRALAAQTAHYGSLLQAMSDLGEGLVVTEAGHIVYCNDAYVRMTGYTIDELGQLPSLIQLAPDEQRERLTSFLRERLATGQAPAQYESQLVTKDGRLVDVEAAVRLMTTDQGSRLIGVVRDVTERRQAQTRLEASERRAHIAARRDPLTGVANRRAWDEAMQAALRSARRDQVALTVALLDLDHFKEYNDDWGHQRGDQLLRSLANAWREALRDDDLLARHGGDEFALLLPGADAVEARAVVDRLRSASAVQQSFSVGIATWDHAETADTLMARADAALYKAKRRSGSKGVVSTSAVTGWAARIPDLLRRHDVASAYQPIVRLDGGEVIGVEALARPRGVSATGSVEELFAAAKRLGYTRDLDWVCRRSAVRCAPANPSGGLLFINVSIHALLDPLHDVDQMQLLMSWGGIPPQEVVLEISERDPVNDPERLAHVLSDYRQAGFRFALDDIGEGHSTLEVLATANPEFIKIARSLSVAAVDMGPQSVIRALVAYCDSSGAQLIAEGLETDLHVQLMRRLGVRFGQGYILGKPAMSPAAATGLAAAAPTG